MKTLTIVTLLVTLFCQLLAQQSQFENFSASRVGQGRRVSSQTLGTPSAPTQGYVQAAQQPSYAYQGGFQPSTFQAPPPFLTQPFRQPISPQVNGFVNNGGATYNLASSGQNQMYGYQAQMQRNNQRPMPQQMSYSRPAYAYQPSQTRFQVNPPPPQRTTNFFGSAGRPNYFPNQPASVNYVSSQNMNQETRRPFVQGQYQYAANRQVNNNNAQRSSEYGVIRSYNRIGNAQDQDLNLRQTYGEVLRDFQ